MTSYSVLFKAQTFAVELTSQDLLVEALEVMRTASDEQLKAFVTIMQEFVNFQQPAHQIPARVGPAPVRKPMKVHLMITGETHGAHQQLLDYLNGQGSRVTPTVDPQQCEVILLFCPVLSRVRSDVEAAIRMIPDGAQGKPVVLVLMHHTRKPDLILNLETNWRKIFPCISLNIHVLYHESVNGLLQCPRNQEAVLTLQSMFDHYMTEKKKTKKTLMQAKTKTEIELD